MPHDVINGSIYVINTEVQLDDFIIIQKAKKNGQCASVLEGGQVEGVQRSSCIYRREE